MLRGRCEIMTQFWQNKRILVTGATGLVGAWLVLALLKQQAEVVAIVRDLDPRSALLYSGAIQQTHVVHGALEDFAAIERAITEYEIEVVFHLGAQTIVGTALRNPLATFETNIRGSYNLLEACRRHADLVQGIVIASSDKGYGKCETLPYTEDMPLQGRHPYDVSKSCTDLLARSYYETYQTPVAITRCGNIYGGGDFNWSRLVPGTIRSLWQGERPVLRSNGTFLRDYVYVQDIIDAYLMTAEHLQRAEVQGEAFNFALDHPHTVLEMVETISHLMDREELEPVILNQALCEIPNQYLSSAKARCLLGWQPKYSLVDSLRETIDWYRLFFANEARSREALA